jgi:uncharacterized SAM-binding protein YcdF (DUF218 family)
MGDLARHRVWPEIISYAGQVKVDAIVALGCRVAPGGRLYGASSRRLQRALEAYRAGVARYLVVSGGKAWHGVAEATAYRSALVAGGVEAEFVLMEGQSRSTLENARYTRALFDRQGWRHAAVVTCDWHLPRAEHCFRLAGLSTIGLGAHSPGMSRQRHWAKRLRERGALLLDLVGATRL